MADWFKLQDLEKTSPKSFNGCWKIKSRDKREEE